MVADKEAFKTGHLFRRRGDRSCATDNIQDYATASIG